MKVYTYDRDTGFYLGEAQADPSPMEPGKFLVPAFSTERKPPAVSAEGIPQFDSVKGKWKIVPRPVLAAAEPEPVAATPDAIDGMRGAVRELLDTIAKGHDFDDIAEAVSYADEPAVPLYQALGAALRAHRSRVWHAFDALVAKIKVGEASMPADGEALAAHLPKWTAPYVGELLSVRAAMQPIPDEVTRALADARAEADRLTAEHSAAPAATEAAAGAAVPIQDQPE